MSQIEYGASAHCILNGYAIFFFSNVNSFHVTAPHNNNADKGDTDGNSLYIFIKGKILPLLYNVKKVFLCTSIFFIIDFLSKKLI